ncbi:TadE family type IV pilus minor pilin [Microbacterium sp. NPDC057407]|uniref:TadE family type IV pilus minor pilin n=1 Tax=Microbacterium sp. NPDC057407 TaxID=3346120 RepID=UPI00366EE6BC
MNGPALGDDRGSVVAEFAVALPAVVLVFMLGTGALAAGAVQVRLQDAVADAARLAARGEDTARIHGVVAQQVSGASARLERRGDLLCVVGEAPGVLSVRVAAVGCALDGGL